MTRSSVPRGHYRVALITSELAPFTAGGIGVLNANLLRAYTSAEARALVVFAGDEDVDFAGFATRYPHADLVAATAQGEGMGEIPEWAFSTSPWHWRSYRAMLALRALLRDGVTVDWLEFQDYGGLAHSTLAQRAVDGDWAQGNVSIRLHGPEAVLRRYEPREGHLSHLHVMDLERSSLAWADLVVGHVPEVAATVSAVLDLSLDDKLLIERPPVYAPGEDVRADVIEHLGVTAGHEPVFLFASKLQGIKAPEMFVKGVGAHLASHALTAGRAVVAASGATQRDLDLLTARLTPDVAARFVVEPPSGRARPALMATSITVVPGEFESFCLVAYEAVALGGRVVVNGNNPAFSSDAYWRHGENCWKFNGTQAGLTAALGEASRSGFTLPGAFVLTADSPYWLAGRQAHTAIRVHEPGRVGVVVTNHNLGPYLGTALESLALSTRRPDQVVVVDDGSQAPGEHALVHEAVTWAQARKLDIELVRLAANQGLSAARNQGLRRLDVEHVLFLDADDVLAPTFLERAAAALEREPSLTAVIPQVAFFWADAELHGAGYRDYALFLGAGHFGRYVANRLSSATNLARVSHLPADPFCEPMTSYEDWDLWARLDAEGRRLAVDQEIGLLYRQRPASMVANTRASSAHVVNLDRVRAHAPAGAGLWPVVMTDALGGGASPAVAELESRLASSNEALEAARVEIERLRLVEDEHRGIASRKVVRYGLKVANARHRLGGRSTGDADA